MTLCFPVGLGVTPLGGGYGGGMQQSDKHAAELDDAMKNPRVEEPMGYRHDGRPEDDEERDLHMHDPRRDLTPDAMLDPDEIELRSDLAANVSPSVFPAGRDELLASADENDAPESIRSALARLDGSERYENVEQVWEALGGHREPRRA